MTPYFSYEDINVVNIANFYFFIHKYLVENNYIIIELPSWLRVKLHLKLHLCWAMQKFQYFSAIFCKLYFYFQMQRFSPIQALNSISFCVCVFLFYRVIYCCFVSFFPQFLKPVFLKIPYENRARIFTDYCRGAYQPSAGLLTWTIFCLKGKEYFTLGATWGPKIVFSSYISVYIEFKQ